MKNSATENTLLSRYNEEHACQYRKMKLPPFREDLTGRHFSQLTVICLTGHFNEALKWLCRCSCGTCIRVSTGDLQGKSVRSYGCVIRAEIASRHMSLKHTYSKKACLNGQIFGQLTVLKRQGPRPNQPRWLCACRCGNQVYRTTASLLNGRATSCGCCQQKKQSQIEPNKPKETR